MSTPTKRKRRLTVSLDPEVYQALLIRVASLQSEGVHTSRSDVTNTALGYWLAQAQ